MIRIYGELSIIVALIFAFSQSILPLIGYYRQNPYLLALARSSALGQCFFVCMAYILLTIAFLNNDFSIAYVAANSHGTLPFMYQLTAVWGAHEGSILLWILMLNVWTLIFLCTGYKKQGPLPVAMMGLISFCFLLFLFFTSNPFSLALQPTTGNDLNPLLQDPGFVIHPPMLYLGYVGFSIAFALTAAALLENKLTPNWARITRQFATAAWCFLTFGIMLGSWWAYRVLGWGGFWFWDPVENASLLPWLSGTALIHILLLVEKRDVAKGWAAFLAIICFALSLLGTFLVRSGVLISAHTFADDPKRGVFLLCLLALLLTSALVLYIIRMPTFANKDRISFSWLSREMILLLNSSLLFVAMATVLLGTLYPLIFDALKLGTISVGAPYFNKAMLPLIFVTLLGMAFSAYSRWLTHSLTFLWQKTWQKLLASLLGACILLWCFTGQLNPVAILTLTLCGWVILNMLAAIRFLPGMSIAHLGFAVLIIGIMLSSLLSTEREVRVTPGDMVKIGPYQFLFIDTNAANGPNYRGIKAAFEVTKQNRHITNLYPEKRIYTVRDMVMTKVDIHPSIFRDLYIALGEPLTMTTWSVRIYYKPFIRWIWLGGILMMLGGFITLIVPRKREI